MDSIPRLESVCKERIAERWPAFRQRRLEWLEPGERFGRSPEKAAEQIVTDLVSEVLDWPRGCVNFQVERADILLTHKGIKRLLIETKAPGAFATRRAIEQALEQARGYATDQYVKSVAVADGTLLYVADMLGAAYRDRVLVRLDGDSAPADDLWRLSVYGIYRACAAPLRPLLAALPGQTDLTGEPAEAEPPALAKAVGDERRAAECFAYVGDITHPATWKLPYLLTSGEPDPRRLSMAVAAVLRNYRGQSVAVPERAVPEILFRLGRAAWQARRFPGQRAGCADVFQDLKDTLLQLGLWDEVQMDEPPALDKMDRSPGT